MPQLNTYCGSRSQKAFRKHIAECGICWAEAQDRHDLTFDAARVCDPRLPDNQETVCLACNEIVFVEAGQDIQARECDDCQRTGTLRNL